MDLDIDEALLKQANDLLRRIKHPVLPYHMDEVGVEHFVALYEKLTDETIPGAESARTLRDKMNICQFLIDSLADDIFGMSLDHITGYKVVTGDRKCISDLLDIFAALVEHNTDTTDANEETQDSLQQLSTPMRDILSKLEEDAYLLLQKSVPVGSKSQNSAKNKKNEFTQTMPITMTSSSTSPFNLNYKVWSDLLEKSRHLNVGSKSKNKTNTDTTNRIERKTAPPVVAKTTRKPSMTIHTYSSSSQKSGLNKVPKPKPVLSTKIRHKSTSMGPAAPTKVRLGSTTSAKYKTAQNKPFTTTTNKIGVTDQERTNTDLGHMIKLLEDHEKIRSRRQEIAKQIRQLEEEDKGLKTVESIIMKEIKFLQQIRTHSKFARSTRMQ